MKGMKVVRIDMAGYEPQVFVSHITQIAPGRLVVRDAVWLDSHIPVKADMYLVELTEYQSAMSGGYTEVMLDGSAETVEIVGHCKIGVPLRPVPPRQAVLVKNGSVRPIRTHGCKNRHVAEAAREGMREHCVGRDALVLAWGGAIVTNAVRVCGEFPGVITFPAEHQTKIVNAAAVEAAAIADEFYWNFYEWNTMGTAEKHELLLHRVIAALLGFREGYLSEASSEALAILARRTLKRLNRDSAESAEMLINAVTAECAGEIDNEKISEVRKLIFPFVHVSGRHDGDSGTYTWYAPADMDISAGDRVEVETYRGKSVVTVTGVSPSMYDGGHRPVIQKIEEV